MYSFDELDGLPNFSDDENEDFSDDENEEMEIETTKMPEISTFLQLEKDPELILRWLYNMLESRYVDQKLHTMMMVSYNSEKPENVQLMLEHSQGKIIDGVNQVMKDCKSYPMARSCAKTIENIMSNSDVNIDWPFVNTICDSLFEWSRDSDEFSYNQPIRNCPEIQTTLASSLKIFVERFDSKNISEAPQYVKEKIKEVENWVNESCASEAMEDMEFFLQECEPILCC